MKFTKCCFIAWFYNFIKKMGRRWQLSEEKTEEKQNSAIIMTSVDGKGTFL